MNARRTSTPLHWLEFYTECVDVVWFMLSWFEREQLLNLQAMGLLVAPSAQRRESTMRDLGPQPVSLARRRSAASVARPSSTITVSTKRKRARHGTTDHR